MRTLLACALRWRPGTLRVATLLSVIVVLELASACTDEPPTDQEATVTPTPYAFPASAPATPLAIMVTQASGPPAAVSTPEPGLSRVREYGWLNQPPSSATASRQCPAPGEWRALYWGGGLRLESGIHYAAQECLSADRLWTRRGQRWIAYSRVYLEESDPWDVEQGEMAFLRAPLVPAQVSDLVPPNHDLKMALPVDLMGTGTPQWVLMYTAAGSSAFRDTYITIIVPSGGGWTVARSIEAESVASPNMNVPVVDGRPAVAFRGVRRGNVGQFLLVRWDGSSFATIFEDQSNQLEFYNHDVDKDGTWEVIVPRMTYCRGQFAVSRIYRWNGTRFLLATSSYPDWINQEESRVTTEMRFTRFEPEQVCQHALLAELRYLRGDFSAAQESCRKLEEIDPNWRDEWSLKVVVRAEGDEVPFCP